ncbi:hypothetical protein XAC217_840007 [Xanthomonas citri pv. citri]|nr:hypothetical protein XAC1083_770008 [Xanthomonas citri pv. citri]CEE86618.1 hypothetical protein XACLC80_960012 [Xanthomonas citri pv. citri]CEF47303.1 hypothetical protein XAC217_840007 [Xanthomonas citri pv. citri]
MHCVESEPFSSWHAASDMHDYRLIGVSPYNPSHGFMESGAYQAVARPRAGIVASRSATPRKVDWVGGG